MKYVYATVALGAAVVAVAAIVLYPRPNLVEPDPQAERATEPEAAGPDAVAEPEPEAVAEPETEPGDVAMIDGVRFRVGDCFLTEFGRVAEVVSCSQPHHGEIFAINTDTSSLNATLSEYVGVPSPDLERWLADKGLTFSLSMRTGADGRLEVSYFSLVSLAEGELLTQTYRAGS